MCSKAACSAAETVCASTSSSSTRRAANIFGPNGSISRVSDFFDMQDEIVTRLATQLGTALIAAEARRAERTPNPDAFDLYLQGMAWLDKGPRPVNVTQSRAFFGRALAIEPDNVDALIGSAGADFWEALNSARLRTSGSPRFGRGVIVEVAIGGAGQRYGPYVAKLREDQFQSRRARHC